MNVVLLVAEPRAGCSGHVVAGLARVLGCRGHRVQVVCSSSVPSGGASRCWDEVDGGLLPLPDLSKARFDVIVATSWLTLELARMFPHAAGGYWLLEYAPDRLSGRQAEVARHGFDANMVLMAASPALQARVETRHGLTSHVVMPGVPPSVAASGSDEGAGTILLAGGKATDEDVRTLGRMVRDRRPETGVRRLGTPTEADDMPVASPDALTREELAQLCAGAALTIWAGCALEYPLVPFLCAAAGRPTVAVAEGLELSPLRPGESMITAELRRPKQAARAIADLLNDAEARASLGAAARSAVAAMTWEAAAQALEEAFERATDRSRGTRGPEAQPVEASVELGAVDVERGLSVVDSPDSRREPAQIGGTECLRLSRTPRAGPVAYFVLAEEWGRPGLQPYVTVEYFDLGEVEWCLEYDPVRLPGDRRSGFVATPAVRNGNTLAWRRAAFHLPDCLFQRTCNLGDFRVHALNAGDTDLYLRTVALQTTKPPAEVPLLGVPDDQGVARITFGEATQELGVQFVDSPDSLSELGQAGGAPCRIARRTPFAGPVLYLRLDPRFVRPEMEAYITVSYYDAGEGEWCLEYERRGAGPEEEFARTLPVRLRSTGEWRTVTFPVTDAVFRRHCNLGDFRLHASNRSSDTLCIAAVTVNRERPEVPLLGLPDDQGAACITFGEVTQELGVQLVDSPDSRSEPGQVAGVACQVARRSPLAGPVLYFRIDPRFVRPAMEAYITVTYCDTGGGEWFVEYERRGAEPEEEYARTLPVRLRNTGEWRMVTFPVTDAVFRRHCNLGDFRIHAYSPSSEALCIAAVSVGREPPEGAALVGVRPDQKTVSVVLGPVPETTGLWAIESPDSVLQPFADQTGSGVRVLRAPENGPVVYFRLDPRFVREGGSYYVTVDYLDAGAEAWIVEYPAWDRDFEPGQFEGTLSVQQTDSGEWRRVTFCLPNARLARACNLGDFRVHAFEPQAQSITLARVQVSKERPSEPGKFIGIAGDDAVISVALQERSEGAGLEQFDSTDAVSAPAVVAGRQCRRVYNPLSSPQAYFRMDHRFVTPNTPVAITLEFLDVGTNYLGLEYDSTDQSVQRVPENLGAFKPAGAIRKTDTGQWRSETFYVSDGRFMRRCNGGDFRFLSDAPQEACEYFARVTVRRLADPVRPRMAETASNIALLPIPEIIRPDAISLVVHADPEVSIIIPVYNKVEYTRQCLYALGETTEGRYEVIVVDNGSTDGTRDLLSSLPGIRYLRSESNLGFARGCNLGAQAAKAPLVLFLNNDTVPQQGWLTAMLQALEQHPGVAIVGARLIYPQTLEVQHGGVAFNEEGLPYHIFHFDRWDSSRVTQTRLLQAVTGACCLIKREAFEVAGGFDEGFLNGFEDIDLCLKIGQAGGRCLYCPEALLLHYESVTEGRLVWENEMANVARFRERWAHRVVRDGASLTAAHPL